MNKTYLLNQLSEMQERINDYQSQVELRILENCPFIIQVGALTITTDENGKVTTNNSNYPTQFTKKAVNEILKMTFKNENSEAVIPKVYSRVEWYKERLEDLKETIIKIKPLLISND